MTVAAGPVGAGADAERGVADRGVAVVDRDRRLVGLGDVDRALRGAALVAPTESVTVNEIVRAAGLAELSLVKNCTERSAVW